MENLDAGDEWEPEYGRGQSSYVLGKKDFFAQSVNIITVPSSELGSAAC